MQRPRLDRSNIQPANSEQIASNEQSIVREVKAAMAKYQVVVVGMSMNPFPKRARRVLDGAGVTYQYMEYGNYFSSWRQRNALKLWTGWPTMPLVFVKGMLVGGADNLVKLIDSGELKKMLA